MKGVIFSIWFRLFNYFRKLIEGIVGKRVLKVYRGDVNCSFSKVEKEEEVGGLGRFNVIRKFSVKKFVKSG